VTEPPAGGDPPGRRRRLERALRVAAVLCTFAFIGLVLARSWPQAQPSLGRLSVAGIAGSFAAALLGQLASFFSWRRVLADCGARPPLRGGLRVFFLGQLGKYLPGSVWSVVAQVELGRDYRVPRRVSGAAVIIFMLLVLLTGLLLGAASLWVLGPEVLDRWWWTLAVLPVGAVALYPPLLNRLVGVALRLSRRQPLPAALSPAGIATATAWTMLAWACYGAHLWVLGVDVGAGGRELLLESVVAFAAAWSVGFLAVFAPAGAGVREALLILALGTTMSVGQATIVALASRLLLSAGDVSWGLIGLSLGRRPPPDPDGPAPVPAGDSGRGDDRGG
jgi:glycosyltransferase 2 family protein